MATMRYLLLGVILACLLVAATAVTDQEFQEFSDLVKEKFNDLSAVVERQEKVISQQATINSQQAATIERLTDKVERLSKLLMEPKPELVQNSTLEERVEVLETQVVEIEEDITVLDQSVNFLFDEQVIQDVRLLNLEERMLNVESENDQMEDEIEGLQDTTLALEFQLTVLEGNVNRSVSELEIKVETLEGTATDHETRITAVEEDIEGLQTTDVNHNDRITALEEYETIAFSAALTTYDTLALGEAVEFNEILLNQGNGYNNTTGVFTVPPGGDGLYYFSTYLLVDDGEWGRFDMRLNDEMICTAYGDHTESATVYPQATCSAVVSVEEGDEVRVMNDGSTDDTPLVKSSANLHNGFNGFRI